MSPRRNTKGRDRAQRSFDVGLQPSLFNDDERAQLEAIAAQASEQDKDAVQALKMWATDGD